MLLWSEYNYRHALELSTSEKPFDGNRELIIYFIFQIHMTFFLERFIATFPVGKIAV